MSGKHLAGKDLSVGNEMIITGVQGLVLSFLFFPSLENRLTILSSSAGLHYSVWHALDHVSRVRANELDLVYASLIAGHWEK